MTILKVQVSKGKHYAEHPQAPVFEDNVDNDAIEKKMNSLTGLMSMRARPRDMRV